MMMFKNQTLVASILDLGTQLLDPMSAGYR